MKMTSYLQQYSTNEGLFPDSCLDSLGLLPTVPTVWKADELKNFAQENNTVYLFVTNTKAF